MNKISGAIILLGAVALAIAASFVIETEGIRTTCLAVGAIVYFWIGWTLVSAKEKP